MKLLTDTLRRANDDERRAEYEAEQWLGKHNRENSLWFDATKRGVAPEICDLYAENAIEYGKKAATIYRDVLGVDFSMGQAGCPLCGMASTSDPFGRGTPCWTCTKSGKTVDEKTHWFYGQWAE